MGVVRLLVSESWVQVGWVVERILLELLPLQPGDHLWRTIQVFLAIVRQVALQKSRLLVSQL